MGRAQPFAEFLFGKKMGGKRWGLLFSVFFTRKIFPAADGRDDALEKSGFLPVTGKSRFCGWGGKSPEQGSVTVVPPSFPLSLSHSSGLRLGEVCRPERKIKRKRKEQDHWARDRL